jgi:hypothetical protein
VTSYTHYHLEAVPASFEKNKDFGYRCTICGAQVGYDSDSRVDGIAVWSNEFWPRWRHRVCPIPE